MSSQPETRSTKDDLAQLEADCQKFGQDQMTTEERESFIMMMIAIILGVVPIIIMKWVGL